MRLSKPGIMKKLLPILLFVACSSAPSLEDSIKNEIVKSLNDADSFEFVEMNMKKEFTLKERMNKVNKYALKKMLDLGMDTKQVENELAYYATLTDSGEVVVSYYDYKFRANNAMGGKVSANYSVTVLKNGKVINVKNMK